MGMIGYVAAIDVETQGRIRNDPSLMQGFLYANDGDGGARHSLDLDKAWHAMHYMLTGRSYGGDGALAMAVLGGEEVGEDMGYGPARFVSPEQVKAVAAALEMLTMEEFERRYNPAEMTAGDIYPGMRERDGREALDYLLHYYAQLVDFYRDAAARGDGVVLWLG